MSFHSATVTAEVPMSPKDAFGHIVPIDLTTIFTGYGPLPAVTGIKQQTGNWDAAGQTRIILLSDGSSAQESLTKYERPHYFSYTVNGFTGTLGLLASSAIGEWWFSRIQSGNTLIKWRYTFNAKSTLIAPILWIITQVLWRGYMARALRLGIEPIKNEVI